MRHTLKRHPDSICDAVTRIEVGVERTRENRLRLHYVATGRIADLLVAPPCAPERKDDLWRTTCFEAFLICADGGYTEFNFAPSTAWAAYSFKAYREGMAKAAVPPPRIETRISPDALALTAEIDLAIPAMHQLALSAVIEEANGRKSYWALAHPPGKPDFHHPDCFAIKLGLDG